MKYHEISNIFPMMSEEEYQSLKDDISENGLLEPIWTYQNQIIDGRNRYRACEELKIKPELREWDGKGSLVSFVVSLNLKRRHLSSSQKAVVALEVEKWLAQEAKERIKSGGGSGTSGRQKVAYPTKDAGKASEQAAKITGTNRQYVSDAKKIASESPRLLEEIRSGSKSIVQAKRELKEDKREKRRGENRDKVSATKSPKEIDAKFATIVLDPPWDWGDEGDVDQLGRAKPTYDTMSFDDLLNLPVESLSDDDCHIYLWITNRSLPKGFALLEKWGFRYVTALTWPKTNFGMGNYFRGQTEHVLFGVKGSQMLKRKDASTLLPQWKRGPNGHSSKPIEFYDFVESCSPGPYLEMFARSNRNDWTAWGAEV